MVLVVVFVKQKTAYELRISDWSSDVCSSDLRSRPASARLAWARCGWSMRTATRCGSRVARRARMATDGDRRAMARRVAAAGGRRSGDRKSGEQGTSVSVRVDTGGRRHITKKIRPQTIVPN